MWHGPYEEIPPRTSSGMCVVCRRLFEHSHRRVPVFIVARIDTHPSGSGRALYACRATEFRHPQCSDPSHVHGPWPPRRPLHTFHKGTSVFPDIEPRCTSYLCPLCKKEFKGGDRVEMAYIIQDVAIDPASGHPEAVASPNFEVIHVRCEDPQLAGASQGQIWTPS